MKITVIIGSALSIIFLIFLGSVLENFRFVFWSPAVILIIFQSIAVWYQIGDNKDRIFVCTDYVYYIGLGAILGLCSIYLPVLERVIRYDASETYIEAVEKLHKVIEDQKIAAREYKKSTRDIETINPIILDNCMLEFAAKISSFLKKTHIIVFIHRAVKFR